MGCQECWHWVLTNAHASCALSLCSIGCELLLPSLTFSTAPYGCPVNICTPLFSVFSDFCTVPWRLSTLTTSLAPLLLLQASLQLSMTVFTIILLPITIMSVRHLCSAAFLDLSKVFTSLSYWTYGKVHNEPRTLCGAVTRMSHFLLFLHHDEKMSALSWCCHPRVLLYQMPMPDFRHQCQDSPNNPLTVQTATSRNPWPGVGVVSL